MSNILSGMIVMISIAFGSGAVGAAEARSDDPGATPTAPQPARSQPGKRPGSLFVLPGDRLIGAYVTLPGAPAGSPSDLDQSRMLLHIRGKFAALEPRDVARIAECQTTKGPALERISEPAPFADLVLIGEMGNRRIRLSRSPAPGIGIVLAEEVDAATGTPAGGGRVVRLNLTKLRLLADSQGWMDWGGWSSEAVDDRPASPAAAGQRATFTRDLSPGRFEVDKDLVSERLTGGAATQLPRASRDLSAERMNVRLPKGFVPRHMWGLLVWIDAGPEGAVPQALDPALDQLGMICVSPANIGNDRPLADRVQLALDAVETAHGRYHIDEERVYVAGISGGGRVASMVLAGFPDIFRGCLGVVGLNSFHSVPTTRGGYYQQGFGKPRGRLWDLYRTRRIGAMTGTKDFNYQEITTSVQLLKGDDLHVRCFDHPPMGHQMGEPEWMTEALEWLDEPGRTSRQQALSAATELMEPLKRQLADRATLTAAQRRDLVKVTTLAPWSPAAWDAASLLDCRPWISSKPETPSSRDP